MNRKSFLGSGAAVTLAACGGHGTQSIPGVPRSGSAVAAPPAKAAGKAARLVPATADPIPDAVLKRPIVGEAWRFEGASAPPSWMFAQGQTLRVADNPALFSVLGTVAGGDGKATFKLPNPATGWIVAIAGIVPASPAALAHADRGIVRREDSLGAGARPLPVAVPKPLDPRIAEARALVTSAATAGNARPEPIDAALGARIATALNEARGATPARLSPASRAAASAAVDAVLAGATSLGDAVAAFADVLTRPEADALLALHDAATARFKSRPIAAEHARPQLEASRYLFSVALTRDAMRAALAHRAA